MLAHVFGSDRWKPRCSLLTEGNTVGVLISGDSGTAPTLGYTEWKYTDTSVYIHTEHCIITVLLNFILYKNGMDVVK